MVSNSRANSLASPGGSREISCVISAHFLSMSVPAAACARSTIDQNAGSSIGSAKPSGVALARAGARLLRLDLAVARRGRRLQRDEQPARRIGDLVDGAVERLGVRLRRLVVAGELADELQRGR